MLTTFKNRLLGPTEQYLLTFDCTKLIHCSLPDDRIRTHFKLYPDNIVQLGGCETTDGLRETLAALNGTRTMLTDGLTTVVEFHLPEGKSDTSPQRTAADATAAAFDRCLEAIQYRLTLLAAAYFVSIVDTAGPSTASYTLELLQSLKAEITRLKTQ